MSNISKACCSIPPVQSEGYVPQGDYETIDGLKTYVTGPADATKAIVLIYDIFGYWPQTLQGADILSKCGGEQCKYRVFIPDLFEGGRCNLADFPPTTDEKKAQIQNFFATTANPAKNVDRIAPFVAAANKLAPGGAGQFAAWGILGLCWGGKIATLLCARGADSLFKCGVQTHPAMLDPEDATRIAVPFATLASGDEDPEAVKKFDANLTAPKLTETFADQIHGWMGARSKLSDPHVREEYERGYKTACAFFCQYL
ncbi:hypothetical protein KEM52_002770 [Ascosphaera acerosa]|nr:hypothetical protein KEM52_002770 [Ascosphaera acerosa]